MSTPRPRPIKDKLTREEQSFYAVLGQFNANVITWSINEPEALRDIIEWMVALCPAHAAQCESLGPAYMWRESSHTCTPVAEALEDDHHN